MTPDKKVYNSILETIGNTPLVKLNKVTSTLPCPVYAKVDSFNPGNSIKDRMAIKMLDVAEEKGADKTRRNNYRRYIGQYRYGSGTGCYPARVQMYFYHN